MSEAGWLPEGKPVEWGADRGGLAGTVGVGEVTAGRVLTDTAVVTLLL